MKVSIFTTMTNPQKRMDPYIEALKCYEDFADEVIIVGKNWPEEFSFDYIGKTFQEGFDLCTGDWVIRMDIDTFFHQNDKDKLYKILLRNKYSPGIAFPKFQIFTPDRFDIKAKNVCIAFNKKNYSKIKLNGGGDLCDLDGNLLINTTYLMSIYMELYSVFKTKIISADKAKFTKALENILIIGKLRRW